MENSSPSSKVLLNQALCYLDNSLLSRLVLQLEALELRAVCVKSIEEAFNLCLCYLEDRNIGFHIL